MKKVVYVMGAGRSGTTLLDILLGVNPGILSAGELNRFPRNDGYPRPADSGSPAARFWAPFREKLAARLHTADFVNFRNMCRSHEYHLAVFRLFWPWRRRPSRRYAGYVSAFFETLFEYGGSNVIVDSSKYPMRAYSLARVLPFETVFVYVKRDPADVVRSFRRRDVEQPSKNWLMANLYLLSIHCLCGRVCRWLRRRHVVHVLRYDDLVSDPAGTFSRLAVALGLDLEAGIGLARSGQPFVPGPLFDGNRLRNAHEVVIRRGGDATRKRSGGDPLVRLLHACWWP
jgi:hypothetical protein